MNLRKRTARIAMLVLLLLVTSAQAWAQSVNYLPSDIGKVLGMDGKVYATVSAAGGMGSVSGMIAYVNTSTHEGIAIGPADLNWNSTEGSGRTSVTNAISSCSGYTRTRPSAATTDWRLPSQADFNNMIGSDGCQSADNLRNMQGRQSSSCGVWAMATDYGYWSSTETSSGSGIYYNLWSSNCNSYSYASYEKYVRPCFTFSVTETYAVSYCAYNPGTNTFETLTANNCTMVTSSTTTMGAANTVTWYVVSSDVTVSSSITVNGTVHLILCDGATLTADDGIAVTAGNALYIYSQSSGTGQLIADATGLNGFAGIGGGSSVGNITIHGGNITATGGEWSAGIGGGTNGGGGSITIYGGNVEGIGWRVNNNGNAVGIGRGSSGAAVAIQADGLRLQYYDKDWQDVTYSQRASGLEKLRVRFFPCTEHSYSDGICTHCGKHEWYIVTYDGNGNTGGSVPTDNTHYANDGTGTVTVRGNTGNLVRPGTGYTFGGWNTQADGLGTNYAAGATFTIYGDITLYAQWVPITYTVRFHKNDGSGVYTDQTFTYNASQPLATNTFTRDGWHFVGWSTETNGALNYADGQSVINLANEQDAVVNLYALWVQNIYTISYDLAGGTVASPNPTTFHEYSSDITLVNPTKAGYYFMGWTGTGLNEPTMTVTIPTGSTGNRTYTATWVATPLTEDTDEAEGTAARWYVNMPATDTKTVTLNDATLTTFKVYDDGGKNGNYNDDCSGYLVLTAPTGYVLQLSGSITSERTYDKLTVYDGSDNSGTKLLNAISSISNDTQTAITTVISTGQSMTLYFYSDYSNNYAGLDLTVTLIDSNVEYNIDIVDAGNNNTLTASVGGNAVTTAKYNDVVTLTASPASGYLLKDFSVVDASGNDMSVTDMRWYTGASTTSFTMPTSAVTVTSTFTNTLTAAGGLYINMPATGTETVTIPEGVQSFKVYDDGGQSGNYSNYYRGYLVLTAPTGYLLQLSGSITAETAEYDYLTVYDGTNTSSNGVKLLDAVSSSGYGTQTAITTVVSSDQSMTLYFYSNAGHNFDGLDLTVTLLPVLELANASDNADAITASDGMTYKKAILADRTLYRDGDWNTLCLPFDVTISGSVLDGATAKTFTSSDYNSETGTLTLNFGEAVSTIEAGKPYIIKWESRTVDLSTLTADYTAHNCDILTGTLGGNYKISIAAGASVTLDGATINGTNNSSYNWAGITCLGDATIILKGTNTVKGFYENYPGIYVPSGSTLTIKGIGSLTARSNGYAAGIGGGYHLSCGNIVIEGGTINATGGTSSAGIGSCSNYSCGAITIANTVTSVTATRGYNAYGSIGVGRNPGDYCATVTIDGVVESCNIEISPYTYTGNGTGSTNDDLVNPVFKDVTISSTTANVSTTYADFIGSYAPFNDNSLLLDSHNPDGDAMHAAISIHEPSVSGWFTDAELTTPVTTIPFAADGTVTLYAAHLSVKGYGEGTDKWVFIASPIAESIAPTAVENLIGNPIPETNPVVYDYDLYRFNQSPTMSNDGRYLEWENYHQHNTDEEPFLLVNGHGYLYARQNDVNLFFNGTMNTANTKTVDLTYDANAPHADIRGWNLVGNPFPEAAYIDRVYYKMNAAGDNIDAVADYTENAIPAYTGVMVKAEAGEVNPTVTFSRANYVPESSTGNGSLSITLSQQTEATRGGSTTTIHDKAIVSFNEGSQLGKFIFNKNHAKLYIPQGREDYAIAFSEKRGVMPVNFEPLENGTYTISVDPEGVEMNYLHLVDNITGIDVDLLQTPSYTFEGHVSDYASRFKLMYSARKDIEEMDDEEDFAFIHDGEIIIEADGIIQVIDLLGRVLVNRDANERITTDGLVGGVYVLRLINGENVKTQKIVVK